MTKVKPTSFSLLRIGDAPNRSQGTLPDIPVEIETHKRMGEADEFAS